MQNSNTHANLMEWIADRRNTIRSRIAGIELVGKGMDYRPDLIPWIASLAELDLVEAQLTLVLDTHTIIPHKFRADRRAVWLKAEYLIRFEMLVDGKWLVDYADLDSCMRSTYFKWGYAYPAQ